jgi:hypothetical protein
MSFRGNHPLAFRDDGASFRLRRTAALYHEHQGRSDIPRWARRLTKFLGIFAVVAIASIIGAFGAFFTIGLAHGADGPMSAEDFTIDAPKLRGKTVSVQGSAACLNAMCFLYGQQITTSVGFDPKDLSRDDRKRLLSCNPVMSPCIATITGSVDGNPMMPVSAKSISFR